MNIFEFPDFPRLNCVFVKRVRVYKGHKNSTGQNTNYGESHNSKTGLHNINQFFQL